jgi:threonine/homoserine/homoserine lactone efflux protein
MLIEYLLSAVFLGIVVAVPPGSVTIIACQRALQYGFRNSAIFTLGSCLSDIFYITLVYIGVANLISNNQYLKIVLWIVCGIILIILGMSSINSIRKNQGIEENKSGFQSNPLATFISGIVITLSNPLTIVGLIVVAGNFFLIWNHKFPSYRNYGIVSVSFIMLGVLIWFVPLIFIVSKLRKIINDQLKKWLILFSNLCLILFGFISLFYAFKTIYDIS